jgi:hypothetical protein
MEAAVAPLAGILQLNTGLLLNCLANVADDGQLAFLRRQLGKPAMAYSR